MHLTPVVHSARHPFPSMPTPTDSTPLLEESRRRRKQAHPRKITQDAASQTAPVRAPTLKPGTRSKDGQDRDRLKCYETFSTYTEHDRSRVREIGRVRPRDLFNDYIPDENHLAKRRPTARALEDLSKRDRERVLKQHRHHNRLSLGDLRCHLPRYPHRHRALVKLKLAIYEKKLGWNKRGEVELHGNDPVVDSHIAVWLSRHSRNEPAKSEEEREFRTFFQ